MLSDIERTSGQNLRGRAGGSSAAEGNTRRRESPFLSRPRRVTRQVVSRNGGSASSARGPQPYAMPSVPSGSALADDDAPVVVIPSFDSEEIESGIRETLSAHGITVLPPRRRRRLQDATILQVSTESLRSTPERQESAGPSQETTASNTNTTQASEDEIEIDTDVDEPMSDIECSTPPIIPPPPLPSVGEAAAHTTPSTVQSLPPCQDLIESTDRLDIGGVAFDPSGTCMYVATVDGISEWTIKGSTTKWWSKGGWL